MVDYSLLVTGDAFDVSYQVFRAIQDNGLVYNGRLIVQADFRTIDDSIFGAGRICEFSQRYKSLALGRSLRMDRYNQTEVGRALAASFTGRLAGEPRPEELPFFKEPVGLTARLFPGLHLLELDFPYQGKVEADAPLALEICDMLDDPGRTEYTSLGFDANGLLRRVFYLGRRELSLDVVRNLAGLHRSYFNGLLGPVRQALAVSFVDYLNEGWAKALFHPLFPRFKALLTRLCLAEKGQPGGAPEDRESTVKALIEENLMDFVSDNKDLFGHYFVPDFKKRLD